MPASCTVEFLLALELHVNSPFSPLDLPSCEFSCVHCYSVTFPSQEIISGELLSEMSETLWLHLTVRHHPTKETLEDTRKPGFEPRLLCLLTIGF
jgi:hypothetical protein